jgi:hypothetical protein
VIEDVYLTAPDGPMVPYVRLSGSWPWVVAGLGAVLVAVGGTLLSHGPNEKPTLTPTTSAIGQPAVTREASAPLRR